MRHYVFVKTHRKYDTKSEPSYKFWTLIGSKEVKWDERRKIHQFLENFPGLFSVLLLYLFGIAASSVVWFNGVSSLVFQNFSIIGHIGQKTIALIFLKHQSVRKSSNEFFWSTVWNYFSTLHLWDLCTFCPKCKVFSMTILIQTLGKLQDIDFSIATMS